RFLRLPAPFVGGAGRVAVRVQEVRQHDVAHAPIDRRGRGIDEVNRQFHGCRVSVHPALHLSHDTARVGGDVVSQRRNSSMLRRIDGLVAGVATVALAAAVYTGTGAGLFAQDASRVDATGVITGYQAYLDMRQASPAAQVPWQY